MDPNNGLCNWISASGQCDYTRMSNFNNYPTADNGYSGGSVFGNGYAGAGAGITDVNATYDANGNLTSYNASSPGTSIWQKIFMGLNVAGACVNQYQQGQAAVEQQQKLQAQQVMQYNAWKEQNSMQMAMAQQQNANQQMQETMKMMLTFAMIQAQMKQMANQNTG